MMFIIKEKYLCPEADIRLDMVAEGKRFDSLRDILFLMVTLKKAAFSEELRERLYEALGTFKILGFDFKPLETDKIKLTVELETTQPPDAILSVIELAFEKCKGANH